MQREREGFGSWRDFRLWKVEENSKFGRFGGIARFGMFLKRADERQEERSRCILFRFFFCVSRNPLC